MTMPMLLSSVLLLLFRPLLVYCDSSVTTFILSYDAILPQRRSQTPTDVSSAIVSDIAQSVTELQGINNNSAGGHQNENQQFSDSPAGSRASVDYMDSSIAALHVMTFFSKVDDSAHVDVTLTAASADIAREALVQLVSKLSDHIIIGRDDDDTSVWSIRSRPSATELKARAIDASDSVSAAQDERNVQAASLETMILENENARNRVRIAKEYALEIWQYKDVNFMDPVKLLFMDRVLQSTTAPASAAHAEALVHPALIAHFDPQSVLLVSRTPSATAREVLKHASVNHISIVGADRMAVGMVEQYMPSLIDCSFLGSMDPHCLHQEQVKIINQDFAEWLASSLELIKQEGEDALEHYYDVVLVDVSIGTSDWLSLSLYSDLASVVESEEAIVVVSSGSQPSLPDVDTQVELSHRERFLRQAARPASHGGLDYHAIHVYDEPLAQPLSSTFMTFFYETGKSYARFVRKNSPMIDNDVVSRLLPGTDTTVYDGPTHTSYMVPSRAWENHYCKTIPGRNLPICKSVLKNWMDASYHHFGVGVRKDKVKGRTVYATEDIPKGHFINPQDVALGWRIEQDQWQALNEFVEDYPEAEMYRQLRDFVIAYGFEQHTLGINGWGVSIACTSTFTNHACTKQEANVSWLKPAYESEDGKDDEGLVFSPPFVRRAEVFAQLMVASKNIKAGDEILQNYITFRTSPDKKYKEFLNTMCNEGVGLVSDSADDGDEL